MKTLTVQDFKIAILQELAQAGSHLHKFNLIGRNPGQRGPLEYRLGITFDKSQRFLAIRAFKELEDAGYVSPTGTDLADPENWIEITDTGRQALQTGRIKDMEDRGVSKFGIQNDSSFQEKARLAAEEYNLVSALFLDLDNFKSVNDNYNHTVGDQVIREAIEIIQTVIKSKGELFHRSGDEMLILLPNFDQGESISVGERIRNSIAEMEFSAIGKGIVTATIGVSTYPYSCPELKKLEEAADEIAMKAKKLGKNRVAYDSTTTEPSNISSSPRYLVGGPRPRLKAF